MHVIQHRIALERGVEGAAALVVLDEGVEVVKQGHDRESIAVFRSVLRSARRHPGSLVDRGESGAPLDREGLLRNTSLYGL